MLEMKLTPRFNDTDALGHINNAVIASWFEEARRPIFKIFTPDLDPKKWNLIIARVEIDYLAQCHYQDEVTVETKFEKIGNSSMTIVQIVKQNDIEVAKGKCVMVHFDYQENKSKPISEEIRNKLDLL